MLYILVCECKHNIKSFVDSVEIKEKDIHNIKHTSKEWQKILKTPKADLSIFWKR